MSPLPTAELSTIAGGVCQETVGAVKEYDHTKVADWNTTIIQKILKTLIEKTSHKSESADATSQPDFKYIVNSTLIQHIGNPAEPEKHGRRGMHSAIGAFWNNEKDGTYSYKWEGAEERGMDIVITITWIAI